jgi:hypothetical protein
MDFQPAEFNHVPYGSIVAAECAPQVEDRRFRGIVIRVPDQVRAMEDEKLALPICGFYQLPTLPLIQGATMHVHVRGAAGTPVPPLSGQVVVMDGANEPDDPDPSAGQPVNPRLFAHKVSEAYFYLDGQRYLPLSLPPGSYEVCVSYGETRSNVARVTIVRR